MKARYLLKRSLFLSDNSSAGRGGFEKACAALKLDPEKAVPVTLEFAIEMERLEGCALGSLVDKMHNRDLITDAEYRRFERRYYDTTTGRYPTQDGRTFLLLLNARARREDRT